ncbi:hypothetical protein Kirov_153 [Bacillus phage Kirov]|uniref:Uncharacterized protein n=1 Tax=Bacillus phage Kirov TaxID=2783539 RepID=A0A7U3RYB6_9CAUD|nr:hypothetical protein PQE67_gp151 [Bacillus phage Kirov]QOV08352.1 hypothetical protein Kirov_153 [Bacillus phage Kirov]
MQGQDLLVEVFADEFEEYGEINMWEIEDYEGVTEYDDDINYNSGWYNYHLVTFTYKGKRYSYEYKTHTSDNVCDTEIFWDTFKEVTFDSLTLDKDWYSLAEVMYLLKLDPKEIEKLLDEVEEDE